MNLNGRVNGGAIMSFADVLGAVGAVANRPPGYRGGTIESKTNFFAAGAGPMLSGRQRAAARRPHDLGVADDDQKHGRAHGCDRDADTDLGAGCRR